MVVPARDSAAQMRAARQAAVSELCREALIERDTEGLMELAAEVVHALLGPCATAILQLEADVRKVVVHAPHAWPSGGPADGEPVEMAALAAGVPEPAGQRSTAVLEEHSLPPHWRDNGTKTATVSVLDDPSGLPAVLVTLHNAPRTFIADDLEFLDDVARVVSGGLAHRWWEDERRGHRLDDPLTGLANRACMLDRIRNALDRRARSRSFVTVFSIDLDRFRVVNDTLGREAGDEVLKAVAGRLRRALRREDTLARMGSDEFAVLSEHLAGEPGAIREADRMLEVLAAPIFVDGTAVSLTASVGIALCDSADRSAEAVMRDADLAMHRAKKRIGSAHELFDAAMRRRAVKRLGMEHGLRTALETDAFELHYQPIVSLEERRIEGVEALIRWNHPTDGLIPPASFIPVAEESGLIRPIGAWVLREACRQAARWAANPAIGDLYVSVNISGAQLTDQDLVGEVAEILRQTGVRPGQIALEVTESVLMRESASPAGLLQQLKDLGVRLFLDDFGAGYSSLGQVKRLPVDVIKIDRALVTGVGEEDIDRRILAAIASMGRALDVSLVAEGIEDVRQAQWLRRLGIACAQGYGFARPKPAAAVELLLREGLPADRLAAAFEPSDTWPLGQATLEPPRPDPSEPDETLTLSEAADALGVSHSTMRRWANSGRVKSVRTRGGHRRFRLADVRRLSALVSGRSTPVLRQVPPPAQELRQVADLLDSRGDRLLVATKRSLYDEGRTGWFAGPAAEAGLDEWLRRLAAAARVARWDRALDATAQLMIQSHRAGSSVAERHGFLERFTEATVRELQRGGADRSVLADARRLFHSLLRVTLTVGDRPAA
jgi:diguanylate cyclase (GGDEF)-like protein/excisionase family DNA binding protein